MFIFASLQIQNFNTISNDLLKLKSDKSKSMNNNSGIQVIPSLKRNVLILFLLSKLFSDILIF